MTTHGVTERCAFCGAPARTRIYLRDAMRAVPSDEDTWCCRSHERDGIALADVYLSWMQIVRLRHLIWSSCFRGSTINVTAARVELERLELAFRASLRG